MGLFTWIDYAIFAAYLIVSVSVGRAAGKLDVSFSLDPTIRTTFAGLPVGSMLQARQRHGRRDRLVCGSAGTDSGCLRHRHILPLARDDRLPGDHDRRLDGELQPGPAPIIGAGQTGCPALARRRPASGLTHMRRSRVLAKIRAGKVARICCLGHFLSTIQGSQVAATMESGWTASIEHLTRVRRKRSPLSITWRTLTASGDHRRWVRPVYTGFWKMA